MPSLKTDFLYILYSIALIKREIIRRCGASKQLRIKRRGRQLRGQPALPAPEGRGI